VTNRSRRELLTLLAAGLPLGVLTRPSSAAAPGKESPAMQVLRVRTITAGVELRGPEDLAAIDRAASRLQRAARRLQEAGYEVQTTRIATNPILAADDADARSKTWPALEKLDAAVAAGGAILSVGPLLTSDRVDRDLGAFAADLAKRTRTISFSVVVSSADHGVHRAAVDAAARVIDSLSLAAGTGDANFRFAAAAGIPAGTPFFPVAWHEGSDSLALGLESAGLVTAAFAGVDSLEEGERRLRSSMNEQLAALERIAMPLAAAEGVRYLGIDPSPAPGMDRSIGGAIETLTGQAFGDSSTLQACATITAALKTLTVRTCGYAGLMLPVLEDPVLAARGKEHRYGLQELLLYSSVCGTGLDVVPIPGDTGVATLARIIGDVATLSVRLRKPLSARLFPVPGKTAGQTVSFKDPRLTESIVFDTR
jgi:hypothetical protein